MAVWHITISAYGFWLPNDPRGSWSSRVAAQHLYAAGGEVTPLETDRSVAAAPHDHSKRLQAKAALKRPAVRFTGAQAVAMVRGLAAQLSKTDVRLYALAMMPDHAHAVVASVEQSPARIRAFLKASTTRGLNDAGLHPLADFPRSNGRLRSPWAEGGWIVPLDTEADVFRTIRYVEQNPVKAGLKPQRWSCVVPFTG